MAWIFLLFRFYPSTLSKNNSGKDLSKSPRTSCYAHTTVLPALRRSGVEIILLVKRHWEIRLYREMRRMKKILFTRYIKGEEGLLRWGERYSYPAVNPEFPAHGIQTTCLTGAYYNEIKGNDKLKKKVLFSPLSPTKWRIYGVRHYRASVC